MLTADVVNVVVAIVLAAPSGAEDAEVVVVAVLLSAAAEINPKYYNIIFQKTMSAEC